MLRAIAIVFFAEKFFLLFITAALFTFPFFMAEESAVLLCRRIGTGSARAKKKTKEYQKSQITYHITVTDLMFGHCP